MNANTKVEDRDIKQNPMGLDGFEFVEFAAPERGILEPVFTTMGFVHIANHRSKDAALFRQGDINFIINYEPNSYAHYFAKEHGPSACGMAFRVKNAQVAYSRALEMGAEPLDVPTGLMELRLPAIKGIGGAPLYLIDRYGDGKLLIQATGNPLHHGNRQEYGYQYQCGCNNGRGHFLHRCLSRFFGGHTFFDIYLHSFDDNDGIIYNDADC